MANAIQTSAWLERVTEGPLILVLTEIVGPDFAGAGLVFRLIRFRLHGNSNVEAPLADFLWRCQEVRPELPDHNAEYDCDVVAARLTNLDPDRGYALLDQNLRAPYDNRTWKPLWIGPRHEFWNALCAIDRTRALTIALEAAKDNKQLLGGALSDDVVDAEADRDVLLEFAARGEEEANVVADMLTRRPTGFRALAFALVERYPASQSVLSNLNWGLTARGGVTVGPMSSHLEACRIEAERALAEEAPPQIARSWLEEKIRALNREIEAERRREADEQVNW